MGENKAMTEKKQLGQNILYLAAWLICSVLLVTNILIIREATLDILTAVQSAQIENAPEGERGAARIQSGQVKELTDRIVLISGAIAAAMLSIFFEYYFRIGFKKGILLQRILKVVGIQAAILLVGFILINVI